MSKSNTDTGVDVTINLNANGGSSTGDSDNKLYSNKYTTYTANGWTKTSGSTTRNYANGASTGALSANLTLYPCFSQSAVYDAVSLPTPSRTGYIFKGWSTNSSAASGEHIHQQVIQQLLYMLHGDLLHIKLNTIKVQHQIQLIYQILKMLHMM